MKTGHWIGLFSGGKDSSYALFSATNSGYHVGQLLTMHPGSESYLFHRPATSITGLMAESMELPITHRRMPDSTDEANATSTERGDAEAEALADAIAEILELSTEPVTGIISGAVESRFQFDRLEALCSTFDLDHIAPLWQCETHETMTAMVEQGFDVRIIAVAAEGLDETWLGRQIDQETVDRLHALETDVGIHPMGEGGEYETIVVDSPLYSHRIEFDARTEWDGIRGELVIADAWLSKK